MKYLKTTLVLVLIVAVFSGAMFGLNFVTGPIIEKNNAGAEFAPLLAVMPEGAVFNGEAKINIGELKDVPESVVAIYKEANGLGFAISCTAQSQYSTAPMQITIGISAEGKISGVQVDAYNDTAAFDFRAKDPNYLATYVGKDSALADVGTVAGSTFSSTAFKNAVSEAMGVLIANEMIAEGKKSDDQVLTELVSTVAPGFAKLAETAASGNITKAMKAENNTGFAYVMTEGDASFLAVVNATGGCKIYDVTGADVTGEHSALADEAKAAAKAEQKDYNEELTKKLQKMMGEQAQLYSVVELDTFNNVAAAVKFQKGDMMHYGFMVRPIGFEQMDIYIVIDGNGAIAKLDAKTIIFEEEYFNGFAGLDKAAYKDGFAGLTAETYTGEQALVTGATMTTNAMKTAVADAFASYESIVKGGQQ